MLAGQWGGGGFEFALVHACLPLSGHGDWGARMLVKLGKRLERTMMAAMEMIMAMSGNCPQPSMLPPSSSVLGVPVLLHGGNIIQEVVGGGDDGG
jgi:hypothetical protein